MINNAGAVAPVDGRFRPESISHFKEVAKNLAWLLERPLQKCQEDLARIYRYTGLHELQQVMSKPGSPGPFDPRYNYLESEEEEVIEEHERRIFFILFGIPKGYWREGFVAKDRCFLVFEMGLFQEAAEHRVCFEKIRQLLSYEVPSDRWPLIHGWPLGLKSWLSSGYTEPFTLAEGWAKVFPPSRYAPVEYADIRWQRRMTGLVRLKDIFQILAPRVGGRKPAGMGQVAFGQFEIEGGDIIESSFEEYYLAEWLALKTPQPRPEGAHQQKEAIRAFVQRPSRATAAACDFVKDLKDPVGFRDRWAFESIKAAMHDNGNPSRALFSSTLAEGSIQSLFLHMEWGDADVSESYGCGMWQLNYTQTLVNDQLDTAGRMPIAQPFIHANGSLIVPFDSDLTPLSHEGWYLCHDSSDFASELAAVAFAEVYLPAIGVGRSGFAFRQSAYSVIEIEELLLADSVNPAALKAYFQGLLDTFEDNCLADSYGYWCHTLDLIDEDAEGNRERNENDEYADNVFAPAVLLINVEGGGLTFVEAMHQRGQRVSSLKRATAVDSTARALAAMVVEAVKGLEVDVVVYDGRHSRT
ncbi:hypothetical protein ACFPOU_17130 [Massilia jejuensis]|uniref:Uncharacterized protein n=1 Tax=Massilia jejuensis TaxID=648894 RepID=A0ABW0PQU5_9BURK